jgi:hypothetical protein
VQLDLYHPYNIEDKHHGLQNIAYSMPLSDSFPIIPRTYIHNVATINCVVSLSTFFNKRPCNCGKSDRSGSAAGRDTDGRQPRRFVNAGRSITIK